MDQGVDERSQIRDFIGKLVEEHWSQTHKAMLLSQLGLQVKRAFPDSPAMLSTGLLNFLTAWPAVQMVHHPHIKEKIGAIPLNVPIPSDISTVFSEKQFSSADEPRFGRPSVRYISDFWKAFYTPIVGRRFVKLPTPDDPHVRIIDHPDGKEEPNSYEILSSDVDISVGPLDEKVPATARRIESWLQRHGLSASSFIADLPAPSYGRHSGALLHAASPIGVALARLDALDQSRISIPLDLVVKMLNGR